MIGPSAGGRTSMWTTLRASSARSALSGSSEMPSGACVIPYDGTRGVVWRIKYRDAEGRQVKETVGKAADGWTRQKAERELGKRLDAVEKGLRRPQRRTFGDLLDEFERVSLAAKP